MAVSHTTVIVCLFLFSKVYSQYYQNYGQYGYQPYVPYQGYPSFNPYQSYQQPYQPYVSSPLRYSPYYYPISNYPIYNSPQYRSQPPQPFFPISSITGTGYNSNPLYSSNNYPTNFQTSSNNVKNETEVDPYANIKTDIIDIEPKYFHYYKKYFNLEDDIYPIEVIDDNEPRRTSGSPAFQPSYIVKSDSKQTNFTNIPQTVKHDVQTKTFSFKKTFTLHPNKNENAVINLNFVNGVQVTETPKEETTVHPSLANFLFGESDTVRPIVEESKATTESEEPVTVGSWFGS